MANLQRKGLRKSHPDKRGPSVPSNAPLRKVRRLAFHSRCEVLGIRDKRAKQELWAQMQKEWGAK